MDDDIAVRALEWMAKPHARGVGGPDVDYQGSVAFFSNQSAAFALNGRVGGHHLPGDGPPVRHEHGAEDLRPPGQPADSHTFVIPRDPRRPRERLDATLRFVARLVNKSLDWAEGGHVPAYRPIFDSDGYRKLSPRAIRGGGRAPRVRPAGLVQRQRLEPREDAGARPRGRAPGGLAIPAAGSARWSSRRRSSSCSPLFLFWPVLSALWASLFDDSAVRVPRARWRSCGSCRWRGAVATSLKPDAET